MLYLMCLWINNTCLCIAKYYTVSCTQYPTAYLVKLLLQMVNLSVQSICEGNNLDFSFDFVFLQIKTI